jgi:hypothetical protein
MTVRLNQPPRSLGKTPEEMGWLEQLARIVNTSISSGTTAQRPTALLYPGRPYFDTSLGSAGKGMMIWRNSDNTDWINATGATV